MRRASALCVLIVLLIGAASVIPRCPVNNRPVSSTEKTESTKTDNDKCTAIGTLLFRKTFDIARTRDKEITALSTLAIALFTIILAVASGLQYCAVMASIREARRSAKIQARLTRQSIGLAREEFLAANRPILRVRYFRQTAGTHDQIDIRFAVVNAGKSRAHLFGSSVIVSFADPEKLGPPVYYGGQDVVIRRNFEVGATDDYCVLGAGKGMEIQNNENYGKFLFVYGYLVYRDDAGNTRTTAFGRRYLRARERFVKINDDDYEYED